MIFNFRCRSIFFHILSMPLRIARFLVLFKFWWLYDIITIKLHYKLWHSHDRMQRYTKYGYIRLRPIACNEFSKYNKMFVFITKLIIICYSLLKVLPFCWYFLLLKMSQISVIVLHNVSEGANFGGCLVAEGVANFADFWCSGCC